MEIKTGTMESAAEKKRTGKNNSNPPIEIKTKSRVYFLHVTTEFDFIGRILLAEISIT